MPLLIFFSRTFGESRDSGSLCRFGLYPCFRYRAGQFADLIKATPDIWQAEEDEDVPAFYPIDDALALCTITFKGGIGWFAGLNLFTLNRWAAKAVEIQRARQGDGQ